MKITIDDGNLRISITELLEQIGDVALRTIVGQHAATTEAAFKGIAEQLIDGHTEDFWWLAPDLINAYRLKLLDAKDSIAAGMVRAAQEAQQRAEQELRAERERVWKLEREIAECQTCQRLEREKREAERAAAAGGAA